MLAFHIRRFADDERGATAMEYALIASLVSIGIVSALTMLKPTLIGLFDSVATGLTPT